MMEDLRQPTLGQRALWYEQQVAPASAAYNFFVPVRIRGALQPDRLLSAFEKLSARHASLRTVFVETDGQPALQVRTAPALDFEHTDSRAWTEEQAFEQVALEAHRPFDLQRGPLFRVRLWTRSDTEAVLLLCLHHSIVDFTSILILLAEAREIYMDRELPAADREFADYSTWQAQMLESPQGAAQWQYWQRLLAGDWPPLALPSDFERRPGNDPGNASQSLSIPPALMQSVCEAAQAQQRSPRDFFLTAFQILLHRWTGQDRLLVGSPFSCRTQAGFERTVGYFANPLAIPSRVSPDTSLGDCLRRTARTLGEATQRQHFPFPLVVERLRPRRSVGRTPLFQALFAFYSAELYPMASLLSQRPGLAVEFGDLTLEPLSIEHRAAMFDLSLIAVVDGAGSTSAQMQYRKTLFRPATVVGALDRYADILEQLVQSPDTPVLEPEKAAARTAASQTASRPAEGLKFGLFFFASAGETATQGKYGLLLEAARIADRTGLEAVWTPERHFHRFGGLFPNAAVTSAAVAAITSRIRIRAGSVVMPLHHPLRIAEEWAVVDNLSAGRAEISIATGWSARDFVLAPDNYADRRSRIAPGVELLRKLWRGESHPFPGPDGEMVDLTVLPRPVQPELPLWLSAFGNPDTFRLAGSLGAGVLTHLVGQTVEELAGKIALYRQALDDSGVDPARGRVAVMLHTFLDTDAGRARETVRRPFLSYLKSCAELSQDQALRLGMDLADETIDAYLDSAFASYCRSSTLFGTMQSCAPLLDDLEAAGVNEIACLIDFGVEASAVLSRLPLLAELNERRQRSRTPGVALTAPAATHSADGGVERAAARRRQLAARSGRVES